MNIKDFKKVKDSNSSFEFQDYADLEQWVDNMWRFFAPSEFRSNNAYKKAVLEILSYSMQVGYKDIIYPHNLFETLKYAEIIDDKDVAMEYGFDMDDEDIADKYEDDWYTWYINEVGDYLYASEEDKLIIVN